MTHRLRSVLLGLALVLASFSHAQVPPEQAVATFQVVDGLEIALWASEPLFANPTSMDVDHLGRVWVCESVNYRCRLFGKPLRRPEGDRILILEDSKGTGRADKATVFYQAPEILAPLGIAVAKDPLGSGYKVFVCQSPDILVFEDRDGDGKADGPPTKLLTGFKGIDHDHGVHGILIGPDNKLYFSVGDQGVQDLRGKNGTKSWTSNTSDCRAGTIWRCELDGSNLELLAHNFRNEYEPCVDSFGTIFVSDNDDDGNQQTRICYVMAGGNYGYHPRGPGQSHWHEEQPGVVPKILRTYFGSPTGMCVYEGTLLPPRYRGQPLHTDAGPRHVRSYQLTPEGASYAVQREDMVASSDSWFRPSDVCVGPDGAVYVADWYDPGVGGHGIGDLTRGRIFRVAPRESKPGVPQVDMQTPQGVKAALASPALSVRAMALARLQSMDRPQAVALLEEAAAQRDNVWLRARALWQLGRLGRLRLVSAAFTDADARFRVQAIRVLKDTQHVSPTAYSDDWKTKLLSDPAPEVRREALLALRDVEPARARPLLYELAKKYDGKDRFYLEAIGIAVGHHDAARRQVILTGFSGEFPDWTEHSARLVWELRPPEVLPLLEQRLLDAGLPASQRAQVVDILAASDDLSAGKALVKALDGDVSVDVRDRVVTNLKLFLPGKWAALGGTPELKQAVEALLRREENITAALALIAAAERADFATRTATLACDSGKAVAVRSAAVQALGTLRSGEAVAALQRVLDEAPAQLRIEATQALANHLQRRRETQESRLAQQVLQHAVTSKEQEGAVRRAAVAGLSSSPSGSQWLLDLRARNELPDVVTADTARLLRNSPFENIRNRALAAFPTSGKLDPTKLPSLSALAARKGDAERGKQLIAASAKSDLQCLKCHTIRGAGGSIGPDLSTIGTKASRENLFESILYPSKAIADQYVSWVVVTNNGLNVTGLLVEETPARLMLRDANGKDHTIARGDIAERARSLVSLMPENLLAAMTEEDLVDMVEYLYSLKAP